ncbi:hypothetical protein FOCC_FOCC001927 [Frankliniella occidentalis]|nr:hypothetical protein FOCC_FOCC001927 [Frankliniella occidentalis]
MVMKDGMPLRTGEKKGFQAFAKKAVPLWKPPGRNKTTNMMEKKYESLSALVKDALSKVPAVCLTADCWTESHNTTSFLGVTAHFPIDTELECAVLGVRSLQEAHDSQYLSGQFEKVLEEWGLETSRVSLVITDNAANIVDSVRRVFGADKHLGCFDHTLNLIPKAALGFKIVDKKQVPHVAGASELVAKVKKIVTFSHRSYNFKNELTKIQIGKGKTQGTALSLLQDVPTRWGSTYLMLERFLEMREVIAVAALKFPSDVTMLTAAELATLEILMSILAPFHFVTKEMSADKTTTASKVIPLVFIIRKELEKMTIPRSDDLATRFYKFVCAEFDRRFDKIEQVMPLAIATLVDPRFQRSYFQDITGVARARGHIEEMMKKHIRESANAAEAELSARVPIRTEPREGEASSTGPRSLWDEHDERVARDFVNLTTDDIGGKARTELRAFLERAPSPRTANPLEVWEGIRHEYPNLYKIARVFLSLVATSVPSERMFSDAGNIVTDKTNRLTPAHLQHRLFLLRVSDSIWFVA